MADPTDPTIQAIIESVVRATGAHRGWLLGIVDDGFVVLGAAGGDQPGTRVGRVIEGSEAAAFAAGSGQPFARRIEPGERTFAGVGGSDGAPSAVLCAPCGADDVVGVIEIVDKPGGFEIADVETVALLADVAGVAIVQTSAPAVDLPSVDDLAAELQHLADDDRVRYGRVAMAIQALLGQS